MRCVSGLGARALLVEHQQLQAGGVAAGLGTSRLCIDCGRGPRVAGSSLKGGVVQRPGGHQGSPAGGQGAEADGSAKHRLRCEGRLLLPGAHHCLAAGGISSVDGVWRGLWKAGAARSRALTSRASGLLRAGIGSGRAADREALPHSQAQQYS